MKKPKFYKNWSDNNHCLQAAIMTVLNTIDGPVSWEVVNKMTEYEDDLYSWTPMAVIALSEKIPGVKLVTRMDYVQFAERGDEYLKEYMSPQWFQLQQSHASPRFQKERAATRKLVNRDLVDRRDIHKEVIERLLAENLLIALVDSGKLVGENWSAGHIVVVYDQNESNFYFHDPGLPPREGWSVDKEKFMAAFGNELIVVPWLRKQKLKVL